MRAAEFDERTNPSTVLYYAPRRSAAAEGSSIRPVLERLNRGMPRARLVEAVPPAPAEEPIGTADAGAARARTIAIAVRCAAVTGVGVGIAAVLAFMLHNPQREDRAQLAAILPAKPVQTVTFKAQDRFGGDAAPATTGAPLRAAAHEVNDEAQAAGAPLAPTVASWAALPPARLPEGWSPDAPIPAEAAAPVAQADAVAHAGAPAAQAKAAQQHDAPARRRAHVRRHHRAAHAPQPQEQPADTPDEKTEAVPQQVDSPLRSMLNNMFRPD